MEVFPEKAGTKFNNLNSQTDSTVDSLSNLDSIRLYLVYLNWIPVYSVESCGNTYLNQINAIIARMRRIDCKSAVVILYWK